MDELKAYINGELIDFARVCERNPKWFDAKKAREKMADRVYGATMYAVRLGLDYNKVVKMYDEFSEKAWELAKNT